MDASRQISRLLANRYFLATLVFASALVILGLTVREILILLGKDGLHAVAIMDEEETVGVLLVGLGVLLEGRELWTRKFAGKREGESKFGTLNFDCEFFGFHLLVLGLFIEVVDKLMTFVANQHWVIMILEYGVYLPLNLLGIWLLMRTFFQILTAKEGGHSRS
jgi:hypothetical protein